MKNPIFFSPITEKNNKPEFVAKKARKLLEKVIEENQLYLEKEIPLKVHPGNPGNISFIKPENFNGIIDFLQEKGIKTYYIETNQAAGGERANKKDNLRIAKEHGFSRIPFVIADGEDGFDHVLVKIKGGKHFQECKIAGKLALVKQVIVLSHFKGHIMSGFGGAIKMLGLGFASGQGKAEMHSKIDLAKGEAINWSQKENLYLGKEFRERSAEYALAAVNGRKFIYINFAVNLVENCDCDGKAMKPIYKDLGILTGVDPVAIDKACFDLLTEREGKKPYRGDDIFDYAEKIGLGSLDYQLIEI